MSAVNRPLDVILALLPSLSDKERGELVAALDIPSVCLVKGHDFRPLDKLERAGWFGRKFVVTRVVCRKCGVVKTY